MPEEFVEFSKASEAKIVFDQFANLVKVDIVLSSFHIQFDKLPVNNMSQKLFYSLHNVFVIDGVIIVFYGYSIDEWAETHALNYAADFDFGMQRLAELPLNRKKISFWKPLIKRYFGKRIAQFGLLKMLCFSRIRRVPAVLCSRVSVIYNRIKRKL